VQRCCFFQPYLQKVLITIRNVAYGRAWVEHSSCEDDGWNYCEESLKLKKSRFEEQ